MSFRSMVRGGLFAASLLASACVFAQSVPGVKEGVPVTGEAGVTERVSVIMERARADDARAPRPPRLNYEYENE